jgi:type IV secretion system protein VirD4
MKELLNNTISFLLDGVEILSDGLSSLFTEEKKTEYDAGFLSASQLLSKFNKGISICGRSLNAETSFRGVLVYGQVGAGKSVCVSIPTCLKLIGRGSVCINDPSGEIFNTTCGAFKRAGYDTKIINYLKPQYGGYNPLHRIKTRADIYKVSEQIIFSSLGRGKDPFWNISATNCLNIFIELALSLKQQFRNMKTVVFLLNVYSYDPQTIDRLILRTNESLIMEYKVFNSFDPKVIQNILATVKAATKIFTDPDVQMTTSYDSVSFENCRNTPTVIYFNNSIADMEYYGLITGIFFEQFFSEIFSHPPNDIGLPIYFILDEASSLYLKSIQKTASNIRKWRASLLIIFQSYQQAVSLYGESDARALKEICATTVYLPGQPLNVSKEISATLGSFQYEDEDKVKRTRLLLTPDEVHQLEHCLVLSGNRRAVRLPMRPFFKNFTLNQLSTIPPYVPTNQLPENILRNIDINELLAE